ncbi:hypothetical protein D1097_02260 [Actinobacillus pleuropneumoniae serovar 4 str. M62]|nr:hypothetical protein D1097_02260 [Actinobacillus pleuropneumoniae serovar 4 str. M62]
MNLGVAIIKKECSQWSKKIMRKYNKKTDYTSMNNLDKRKLLAFKQKTPLFWSGVCNKRLT